MDKSFVSPTGSIELDNDCTYSIDNRNVRSRETVIPTEDLPIYFKEYIEPKYGLGNINVTNVASFMKDLEMNWTKLTPELKDKVLNILVDFIFNDKNSNYDFKTKFMEKLGVPPTAVNTPFRNVSNSNFASTKGNGTGNSTSTSKSSFGKKGNNNEFIIIGVSIFFLVILIVLFIKNEKK
jgi:hypothetical protein